jgi:leucyl-tRNA synthetase
VRILYPVTPHLGHVLWTDLGFAARHGDILDVAWPEVDPDALLQEEIELVVQVNGKLRGSVRVPAEADRSAIEAQALADENVQRFLSGPVKKVILVPGRLVNIVV